jgi:hypothetical protein
LTTLAVYNYQRLYKSSVIQGSSPWLDWVRKNRTLLILLTALTGLTGAVLLILIVSMKLSIVVFLFTLILVSVFYVIPIRGFVLREFPAFKSVLVSFVWTGFLIAFPLINEHQPLRLHALELIAFFSYFFALTIPFDIRDLKYDKLQQRTIPQLLGVPLAQLTSILLLGVFLWITAKINNEMRYNILFYIGSFMAGTLILMTHTRRSEWFFALIDGSMIVVGISIF